MGLPDQTCAAIQLGKEVPQLFGTAGDAKSNRQKSQSVEFAGQFHR